MCPQLSNSSSFSRFDFYTRMNKQGCVANCQEDEFLD